MVRNLKKFLNDKNIANNVWLTIPSSWTAEVFSSIGFDCLTIDMQHGLADYNTVISMLQSFRSSDVFPIVRVPWNDPAIIMKVLDAGAKGIISPMINSEMEAKEFAGACKYPPLGFRSYGPIRAELVSDGNYFEQANDQTLSIAMIETVQAVENIDAILSVEGLDGIYIGTMDLSISLGVKNHGELANEALREAIEKIMISVKKHGLFAGMHTRSIPEIQTLKGLGISLITSINDSRLLRSAAESVFKQTVTALKN